MGAPAFFQKGEGLTQNLRAVGADAGMIPRGKGGSVSTLALVARLSCIPPESSYVLVRRTLPSADG